METGDRRPAGTGNPFLAMLEKMEEQE